MAMQALSQKLDAYDQEIEEPSFVKDHAFTLYWGQRDQYYLL